MEKRIKLEVSKAVDSGTTDGVPSGVNDLTQSGQDFVTTVSVGDRVHNTTDDEWHSVLAVVDNENLTLNGGTVATAKAFTIYSGTETLDKYLPSIEGAFVASASASSTTVSYTRAGSTGTDVITLTHEADGDYNAATNPITRFETSINDAITEAYKKHWTTSVYDMANPGGLIITAVAIG